MKNVFTVLAYLDSRTTETFIRLGVYVYLEAEEMKAKTVTHVEYEILKEVLENIPLNEVEATMVNDTVTEKRFTTAAKNVAGLIRNLMTRRQHRLPAKHPQYKQKEEFK